MGEWAVASRSLGASLLCPIPSLALSERSHSSTDPDDDHPDDDPDEDTVGATQDGAAHDDVASNGTVPTESLVARPRRDDADAQELVSGRVYSDPPRIARLHMQHQGPGRTLRRTALVHEVFLKIASACRRPARARRTHLAYPIDPGSNASTAPRSSHHSSQRGVASRPNARSTACA